VALNKEDLATLWRYAQDELTSALLWKVAETEIADPENEGQKKKVASGLAEHRIFMALEEYFNRLQALYKDWRQKNPTGGVADFVFSPSFPRFRLPKLRGGSRESLADVQHWQSAVEEYERCCQQLKQKLKKRYLNPAARKRDIQRVLKEVLGVEEFPQERLELWKVLPPEQVARAAVAWHTHHGPSYIKKKASELRRRKQ
jgi:hypothetical protein